MVCMCSPTAINTKENGSSVSDMVTDQTFSQMATALLANIWMASLKDLASTSGEMAAATPASSTMA